MKTSELFKKIANKAISENACDATCKNSKRIYIYAPYDFKDEVKASGASFDYHKKQWYIFDDNPNKDYILNKFYPENFRSNFHGFYCLGIPKKIHDSKKIKNEQERKELKAKWIETHGSNDGFGAWYSVKILGHE